MKILIRHQNTGFYYKAPGCWTKNIEDAYSFPHGHQALDVCLDLPNHQLEIVYRFDRSANEFVVALRVLTSGQGR